MELPLKAADALATLRRDARDVRLEVSKVCGDSRYRLSARYRSREGVESRVGLLYSADRGGLEELRARLESSAT